MIEEHGTALLGSDQVVVIDPCRADMSVPEIAFVVEADDDAGARREAERRMVALRRHAGLPARRAEARSVLLRPHPPANG